MGMFDCITIKCPFCQGDIEEQTKAGPCLLETYQWDDPNLPVWMMDSFNGSEIECYNCEKHFVIRYDYEVIVKSRKLEPIEPKP